MRIEKISETQVKFILSKSDLAERDIKITELAHNSEKTHRLFQEILRQAHTECAFESENAPLMVEAMPVGQSHVVIVVTKVTETTENPMPPIPPMSPMIHPPNVPPDAAPPTYQTEGLAIFSFKDLDIAAIAARRLHVFFMGQSRLYRCDKHYFLVIQEDVRATYALQETELVLQEYGEKHISSGLSEHYLAEHGEILIGYQAVEKLALYL